MQPLHTVAEIRAAEQVLLDALPEGALMDRAATALALTCLRQLRTGGARVVGARVVLVVGAGNNGGDALVAGAHLARRGVRVVAVLLDAARAYAPGVAALRRAGGRLAGVTELADLLDDADLAVDGIVGIGASGALREPGATAAATLNDRAARVVAVDLPSGVDADTGEIAGVAVRADVTVTFGAGKPGLFVDPGAAAAGRVEIVDIGLGPHLPASTTAAVTAADLQAIPVPGRSSQKYSRGVLGLSAGSPGYPGAAVLATAGALAGPIGMLRFSGPDDVARAVLARFPEVVVGDGRVQAHAIGPGLGHDRADEVHRLLTSGLPLLVDADGLSALPARLPDGTPILLTPHAGELARLLGVPRPEVEARPLAHARRAATQLNATVLLKGATTVIARPDGEVRISASGTGYLATAGAGDVLSGFTGALLASGLEPLLAGALGAFAHGAAARAASGEPARQIVAADVAAALPAAVAGAAAEGAVGPGKLRG